MDGAIVIMPGGRVFLLAYIYVAELLVEVPPLPVDVGNELPVPLAPGKYVTLLKPEEYL